MKLIKIKNFQQLFQNLTGLRVFLIYSVFRSMNDDDVIIRYAELAGTYKHINLKRMRSFSTNTLMSVTSLDFSTDVLTHSTTTCLMLSIYEKRSSSNCTKENARLCDVRVHWLSESLTNTIEKVEKKRKMLCHFEF